MIDMQLREVKELIISAIVIALAYSIASLGGIKSFFIIKNLFITFISSLLVVSLGFVLHELGHRSTARKFGCYAEYRMWPQGLLLAMLFSFLGFLFAAPGAVVIHPRVDLWGRIMTITRKKAGIIAISGPITNFILSLFFYLVYVFYPLNLFYAGAYINAFLGVFNLIPFPPFDGQKVFVWDRKIWLLSLVFGLFILFIIL